jgi:hypothetical protein
MSPNTRLRPALSTCAKLLICIYIGKIGHFLGF